jgi:signal transduction histidine kinase
MKINAKIYKSLLDPKAEALMEHVFRDRMDYLGLMSSALVHELQIPMVIMRGKVESLLRHPQLDPKHSLMEISTECEHLLNLLDSMKFVAPRSADIQLQSLSLHSKVKDVLLFFNKACLEQGISVQVEIPENLKVLSEPNRLKNIIIALMSNAVESFMGPQKFPVKNILIHTISDDYGIHLGISDTGCGMNDIHQKLLMTKPFFSTKQKQGSSGLGLSLSKKMAKDLNLDISFVSEENQGTSFCLSFPKAIYSVGSASSPSSSS